MNVRERVADIFRELAGDAAGRLAADRYLADVNSRITAAIAESRKKAAVLAADHVGFHVVDWQAFRFPICSRTRKPNQPLEAPRFMSPLFRIFRLRFTERFHFEKTDCAFARIAHR